MKGGNKKRIALISLSIFAVFLITASSAYAINYQSLAPIQAGSNTFIGTSVSVDPNGLSNYLNTMYRLGIALCGGLAVIMIVVGGIQYVSSDAWSKKDDGKKRIYAAVLGLMVALGSYVLLNTINPALLDANLQGEGTVTVGGANTNGNPNATAPTAPATTAGSGTTVNPAPNTPEPTIPPEKSEATLRQYFADNGISINNPPCTNGQTLGCSNVAGLGDAAISGLVNLKNQSGGNIVISGGTEDGHVTHGVGKPIVDIRHDTALDNYIIGHSTGVTQSSLGPIYTLPDGSTYMNETSGGDHWHIVFK